MAKLQMRWYYRDVKRAFSYGVMFGVILTLVVLAILGVFQ